MLSSVLFRLDMASSHLRGAVIFATTCKSGCGSINYAACYRVCVTWCVLTGHNVSTERSLTGQIYVWLGIWLMAYCYNTHCKGYQRLIWLVRIWCMILAVIGRRRFEVPDWSQEIPFRTYCSRGQLALWKELWPADTCKWEITTDWLRLETLTS